MTARSTADWAARGVGRARLRGSAYRSPHRGVHADAGPEDDRTRVLDAAVLLPAGGAVGGWAAALLLGAGWPDGRDVAGATRPVPLVVPRRSRPRPRDGVRHHRSDLTDEEVVLVAGVPVTAPARTAFDLLRWGAEPREAVADVDGLLAAGLTGLVDVVEATSTRRGWPGSVRAGSLLPHLSDRSRSPQETRLRLVWTLDARLPPPLVNCTVLGHDGRSRGTPDLLDTGAAFAAEFDGRYHLDGRTAPTDRVREEGLTATGLTVARFYGADLTVHRRRTVHRLQQGRSRGLARERSADSWHVRLPDGSLWWP
ncbi:hypothetical protein [Kineococcus sp. SYSU DK004]|uniref:hypothetical protein n=1 Tax=Kineococcus sp. SYSU DK004 TaxID=3383125 RepID=UPI003D7D2296